MPTARALFIGASLPIGSHQLCRLVVFPAFLKLSHGRGTAGGAWHWMTYETVRQWGRKFGKAFSHLDAPAHSHSRRRGIWTNSLSRSREQHWRWRAVDQNGVVLDVLIQCRRDSRAAQRLMTKLLKSAGTPPRVMIADKLRSYGATRAMGVHFEHRWHKSLNNRAENSHQPTRRRQRIMKLF